MKQKLYLDINIVIDLLAVRHPFYESISKLIVLGESGNIKLITGSYTYPTIYYVLSKSKPNFKDKIIKQLRTLRTVVKTSDLTDEIIERGLNSEFNDFEDALQYYSALAAGCDVIITRNAKDFINSNLPVMTADEYLNSRER